MFNVFCFNSMLFYWYLRSFINFTFPFSIFSLSISIWSYNYRILYVHSILKKLRFIIFSLLGSVKFFFFFLLLFFTFVLFNFNWPLSYNYRIIYVYSIKKNDLLFSLLGYVKFSFSFISFPSFHFRC